MCQTIDATNQLPINLTFGEHVDTVKTVAKKSVVLYGF